MDIDALFVFDGTTDQVRDLTRQHEVVVTVDVNDLIQTVNEALCWLPANVQYERPQLVHDCITRCLREVGKIDGTPLTKLKKNVNMAAVVIDESSIVHSRLLRALWFHAASNDIRHYLLSPYPTQDDKPSVAV